MSEEVMNVAGYDWPDIQEKLRMFLDPIAEQIKASMDSNGVNASGRTRNSIKVVVEYINGVVRGAIKADRHFPVIETGRDRTRHPSGWNGLPDVIYQWSIDKGITFASEKKRRSFSRSVAYLIHRNGTRLYQHGGRKNIYSHIVEQAQQQVKSNPKMFYEGDITKVLKTMFRGNITTTTINLKY